MKALICEMCNSQELVKQDGMYICQSCGTKYAPDEAKKLLLEINGTVKIDNSAQIENYYQLAMRAKECNDFKNALKYFELLLSENTDSWEANFYSSYYSSLLASPHEIVITNSSLEKKLEIVLLLVKNSNVTVEEIANIIFQDLLMLVDFQIKGAKEAYESFSTENSSRNNTSNYVKCYLSSISLLYDYGDRLIEIFTDNKTIIDVALLSWKNAVDRQLQIKSYLNKMKNMNIRETNLYQEKIDKYILFLKTGSHDNSDVIKASLLDSNGKMKKIPIWIVVLCGFIVLFFLSILLQSLQLI